jgi:hypothetical protein
MARKVIEFLFASKRCNIKIENTQILNLTTNNRNRSELG